MGKSAFTYIPDNFKIGLGKMDKSDIFRGAVTFKNTNGAWIQPTYFQRVCGFPCIDNPRDAEVVLKRDMSNRIKIYKNDPTEGFKLTRIHGSNYDSVVSIYDPRGWNFIIYLNSLVSMLNHHLAIKSDGILEGKFVYGYDSYSNQVLFYNVESDTYKYAIKESDVNAAVNKIKTSKLKKNLTVGSVYRIYQTRDIADTNYKRAVYLGSFSNICDPTKFYSMLECANATGYFAENQHEKAKAMKESIQKDFGKPKMVFLILEDHIQWDCVYENGVFSVRKESQHQYHRDTPLDVYVDQIVKGHKEYSLRSSSYERENNLYVCQNFDSMKIRGLDTDQTIACKDKWLNDQPYSYKRTIRHQIMARNYSYEAIKEHMFTYKPYTADELIKFVNYMINNIMIPNLTNLKIGNETSN